MIKILTHTFKVTVFEDSKFCWINPRWEEKTKEEIASDYTWSICLNAVLGVVLLLVA